MGPGKTCDTWEYKPEDSLKQHKELADWLAPIQYQLDTLNAGWFLALRMKGNTGYDTSGLAEVRTQAAALGKAKKRLLLTFALTHPDYLASLTALNAAMVPVPDDITAIDKVFKGLHSMVQQNTCVATKALIDQYTVVAVGSKAPDFAAPILRARCSAFHPSGVNMYWLISGPVGVVPAGRKSQRGKGLSTFSQQEF